MKRMETTIVTKEFVFYSRNLKVTYIYSPDKAVNAWLICIEIINLLLIIYGSLLVVYLDFSKCLSGVYYVSYSATAFFICNVVFLIRMIYNIITFIIKPIIY